MTGRGVARSFPVAGSTLVAFLVIVAFAGCSDDASPEVTTTTTTTNTTAATADGDAPTTTVPTFTGDASSPFCMALVDAAERPVLDPFAAGIDAREIELRIRTILVRFEGLVATAPPDIAPDVERVATGLLALDETLETYGYDLGAAGEAGADLSFLDAPEFDDVARRVTAYQDQVCDA